MTRITLDIMSKSRRSAKRESGEKEKLSEKSEEKVSGTFYGLWPGDLVDSAGMGRPKRASRGEIVYHVLNRANARLPIFEKDEDYEAFERILEEAVERYEMRLLA